MAIAFTGYYGMRNIGDDSFCAVADWGARRYWRQNAIGFLSRTGPSLPNGTRYLLRSRRLFRGQTLAETLGALMRARYCICAGGSVFHSRVSPLSRYWSMSMLQRLGKVKLGAIGVSLGPFGSTQAFRENAAFLKRFSFLCLRDRQSYEIAKSLALPYEPVEARDLAFLLPRVYGLPAAMERPGCNDKPLLGVSLCHYERFVGGDMEVEARREDRLREALTRVVQESGCRVRFFIFNGHPSVGDIVLTNRTVHELSENARTTVEVVEYTPNLADIWSAINQCTAFLSVRLHGGIFSCAARVPVILVEYHRKCTDFLNDAGHPIRLRIGDAELPPRELAGKILSLLEDRNATGCAGVHRIEALAELNFKAVTL